MKGPEKTIDVHHLSRKILSCSSYQLNAALPSSRRPLVAWFTISRVVQRDTAQSRSCRRSSRSETGHSPNSIHSREHRQTLGSREMSETARLREATFWRFFIACSASFFLRGRACHVISETRKQWPREPVEWAHYDSSGNGSRTPKFEFESNVYCEKL